MQKLESVLICKTIFLFKTKNELQVALGIRGLGIRRMDYPQAETVFTSYNVQKLERSKARMFKS